MTRSSLQCLAVLAAAGTIAAVAAPAAGAKPRPAVTVMTRNLYLGADLLPAAGAQDQTQLRAAATAIVNHVKATDFPARAKLLAAEIAKAKPDLVGLQEVATWRRTRPGEASGTPATAPLYDWLGSLQKALHARHRHYRMIAAENEFDFQLPTDLGYDARLSLRDVVLATRRVKLRARRSASFEHILSIPTVAGTANIHRGYNRVDVSVRGARLRFVNTHLEAYSPTVREAQAKELVAGPLQSSKRPVILAGDLNSDRASTQPADRLAYEAIAAAGFKDRATRKPSCCHDDTTLKSPGGFDHIVDHIMSKPKLRVTRTRVTGNGPRTSSGLWPSDHGGLVATLRLR